MADSNDLLAVEVLDDDDEGPDAVDFNCWKMSSNRHANKLSCRPLLDDMMRDCKGSRSIDLESLIRGLDLVDCDWILGFVGG